MVSELTINPVAGGMNNYRYRAIATNSRGNITSSGAILTLATLPTSNPGAPLSSICGNTMSAPLGGSVTHATGGIWSSDAGGVFSPSANDLNATWTPPIGYSGTATLTLTTVGGCTSIASSKTQVVNPAPSTVLNPSSISICEGAVESMSVTNTVTTAFASGNVNLAIPNFSATGVTHTQVVSGIPAGAIIKNITVTFNVTHPEVADLMMNIKAPNGNVLNLANRPSAGPGTNFTNTRVSATGTLTFASSSSPFNNIYAPMAALNVGASGNLSNVTSFNSLMGTMNGNWIISARDAAASNSGTLNNWTLTIEWIEPTTWSPFTHLYTNAGATIAYTGQSLETVYFKGNTTGSVDYTVTQTGTNGCVTSTIINTVVNEVPEITIYKDYCAVPGQVVLTAQTDIPVASYVWNTGATTQAINADIALPYQVIVTSAAGCKDTSNASVGIELIQNGNFESGNTGFTSNYTYVSNATQNGLYPEERYTVSNNPNYTHNNFWGADHTSGTGMMMIVNGSGSNPPINVWQQTVAVTPNTDYYFSAWAISMNSAAPFANLQFKVNGTQVGTTTGALPPRANNNNPPFDWVRFYGTWNSGSATSAVVSIIDLEQAAGGNDFAIDDISFGSINPFINLTTPGTDTQSVCINTPILDIEYEVGGEDTGPAIVGLPPGVTSTFNGNSVIISGTPTVAGVYNYSLSSTGACANVTRNGQITVNQRTIALTSAVNTDNQLVCIFNSVTPITYAIGGSATDASVSGLPAGVSGIYNAGVITISGSPIVTGTFNYTVSTTGTCEAVSAQGTIVVTRQTLTLTSANQSQTVCVNAAIANIIYEVGGAATGAGVVGLPPGVNGIYNAGIFTISGTPTVAGTYNFTVTTTGTCNHRILNGTITVGASDAGNIASVSLCNNGSGNLTLSGHNGNVIRWESSNDGNNWTPIVNTTTTQSYNFTGSTLYYRAVVQYSTCDPVNSNTATVALSNYWTGAVSNDWQNPANWADGNVPSTICPDVIIPVVTTVYPSLNSGMAIVNNLNVYPGALLEISGGLLQIAGTITASGNINATAGTIELNGTLVSQQISGSYFLNNELGGLIVSNGHDVNITGTDTLNIIEEISFGASGAVLYVNNNLTLVSDENGTARVADITNGGTLTGTNILGNVTVERYIPEHSKAWQFLSVPTKGSTIRSSWMEGNTPMGNLRPGRGTLVTGQVANAVAQGFDLRTPAGATVKVYNSNTNVFDGVTSTLTTMDNMKGYMLLVRGDRSVTTSTAPATATTLRTTGQLYTLGAEAPPVVNVAAGKYEAIGNPYPSAISFDQLNRSGGIADMFYLWDPLLTNGGSAYGLGGFQTFTKVGMNYVVTPGGGSYAGGNTEIESGSAFLVYAPVTAGTITFTESAKVDGHNIVNRNNLLPEYFRTQLYAHNNGNPILLDGVMNVFDIHSSNGIDENDAPKMTNTGENLGIKRDGAILAVESRLPIADSDTIQYNLTQLRVLTYQMVFIPNNTEYPDMQAFFEDAYMNTSTPVSLTDTTRITFNVVNIPGSYAPNRFRLVFKSMAVLPVTFTSISANANVHNDVDVVWRVEDEINMEKYELEKSADGRSFSYLASFNPIAPNGGRATYRYNDVKPGVGNWYYRVKGISINGLVQYSSIARASIDLSITGISVHPVPVEDKTIMIHFDHMEPDRYQAVLTNSAGQIVHRSVFKTDTPNQVISIKLNDVPRGVYYLQLKGMVTYTRKLMIN
ncbi:MAG TPA: proprotein convertase P-domain-containing protein [Ferruginibacter sp.]|nr:proprotein convertase P-domain-containing protein [Ferruginibacter sp.]